MIQAMLWHYRSFISVAVQSIAMIFLEYEPLILCYKSLSLHMTLVIVSVCQRRNDFRCKNQAMNFWIVFLMLSQKFPFQSEHFSFLGSNVAISEMRCRSMFYTSLGRLLMVDLGEDEERFYNFMLPLTSKFLKPQCFRYACWLNRDQWSELHLVESIVLNLSEAIWIGPF